MKPLEWRGRSLMVLSVMMLLISSALAGSPTQKSAAAGVVRINDVVIDQATLNAYAQRFRTRIPPGITGTTRSVAPGA
jgi:hypothetical protein